MTRGSNSWRRLLTPVLIQVLAFFCSPASAQDSGNGVVGASGLLGQIPQSDQAPHTVRGTVVNGVTGEPIYRALVQIGGQYATLTDHEGHYEFEGVTENISPWAMKPGYFAENRPHLERGATSGSAGMGTQSGDEPTVVKLVPEAIISGTVTGQDGAPLEGIPVQLKVLSVQDGLSRWNQRQGTKTNSEGQYRFAELEAGKYAVTTGFHTEGLGDAQGSLAYVPARYPVAGGGSVSTESAIVAAPGDHIQADLTPEVERLYPVTGTISGYGQSRGVSFRVQTGSGEEIAPVSRFTARTGEFRLMLPGGSYQVTATAYMREGPMEARREVTVPQAPVSGVSFAMEPYATIPVDLEFDAVNQAAEGTGQADANSPQNYYGGNIGLTSASGSGFPQFLPAQPVRQSGATPGVPGPLSIENISPGRYILRAQPQPPWYVSSASCGSVDLTRDELVIAGGAAGCSIRIVLRNDSGAAHATIRDASESGGFYGGRPLFVYALPVGDLVRSVVMLNQQNAEFSASGIAPGRYLVLALDHREELPYRDTDAMRRYAGLGADVTVTPNGTADVEIGLATEAAEAR